MTTSDCPRCLPTVTLDLCRIYCMILPSFDQSSLCLRQSQLCQFYLTKGRGANGNLRINQKTSKGCLVKMNYSYGIAAESTASSPCSNVPIYCPICPKTDPAIWKYFMKVHFEEKHKTLDLTKYEHLWRLSNFKKFEIKKIWIKRWGSPVCSWRSAIPVNARRKSLVVLVTAAGLCMRTVTLLI
jgi:hypothetical protein